MGGKVIQTDCARKARKKSVILLMERTRERKLVSRSAVLHAQNQKDLRCEWSARRSSFANGSTGKR